MNDNEKIQYLLQSIESLIDAKLNQDGGFKLVEQARADIREALAILFNIELK